MTRGRRRGEWRRLGGTKRQRAREERMEGDEFYYYDDDNVEERGKNSND